MSTDHLRGRCVRVVRGRKIPRGTIGVVTWAGEGKFGARVGIRMQDGELVYTAAGNVEIEQSPEAREMEAQHSAERDQWRAARQAERDEKIAEARQAGLRFEKDDLVVPSEGQYVGLVCRVKWVSPDGSRFGVQPRAGKPMILHGRPVWPNHEMSWVPLNALRRPNEQERA